MPRIFLNTWIKYEQLSKPTAEPTLWMDMPWSKSSQACLRGILRDAVIQLYADARCRDKGRRIARAGKVVRYDAKEQFVFIHFVSPYKTAYRS